MTALFYLLKLLLCSGLLFGYYYFFLRNRRFHRYNRFYLLAIVPLSALIPALKIPFTGWQDSQTHPLQQTIRIINAGQWEEPVTVYAQRTGFSQLFNTQNLLLLIYAAGLLLAAGLLIQSLVYIARIKRQYPFQQLPNDLTLYQTTEAGTPFSFFRSIFWNKDIALDQPSGQQIFRHECFHVQQRHSADVLFMEFVITIAWFNPFFHLIRKELKAIHEFLADEYALAGDDGLSYAELLVTQAIRQKANPLTHPFFHNQLKRRITMITASNLIRRSGYLRRILALPLLLLLVSSFAVKLTRHNSIVPYPKTPGGSFVFVIDPGHGGQFSGAMGETGMQEKDITLAISKKIMELAPTYNVKVRLTRETDETVGGATDLKQDLENRVQFAKDNNADAFVSIHVNSTPEKTTVHSGFEADVLNTANTQTIYLAHTMLQSVKDIYTSEDAVRKRQAPTIPNQNANSDAAIDQKITKRQGGLFILQNQSIPAFILECGYLNNPKDAAFISDPKNQEAIARKILEGLAAYQQGLSIGVATDLVQVSDTLSGEAVSKLDPNNIRSISADMKKDLVTINFKSGRINFASAKEINKYYDAHPELANGKSIYANVDMRDSVVDIHNIRITPSEKNQTNIVTEHNTATNRDIIFTQAEKESEYPGGQEAWVKYLNTHLVYPQRAVDNEVQGTVVVQFIVDVDGSVSDIKAISGPSLLRAESVRVIKESGKWEPAVQNGKKVKSYKKQPISYRIQKGK